MDSADVLHENIIKIEEVKQEPDASGDENSDCCNGWSTVTVKSEFSLLETADEGQDTSQEEEPKHPVAVFLQPKEEVEEHREEHYVKSELNTFETAAEVLNDSDEEELKPLAAVFLQPKVEPEDLEEEQDPLAVGGTILQSDKVKVEETEKGLCSPRWGGGYWETEDQGFASGRTESGAPGNSMETEHLLYKSTSPKAKSFQCAMCMRHFPETQTVASHTTHSERRLVCWPCTKIFSAKNAIVVLPILNEIPASTQLSGDENIHFYADQSNVSSEYENLKNQPNSSQQKTNFKYIPFGREMCFLPGKKPYECGDCKMRFSTNSHLKRHILIHIGEKPFECGDCKMCFPTKSNLKRHRLVHIGEKSFECGDCKMRFRTKSGVVSHGLIHTGEKPFECGECKKFFRTKSEVVSHSRIHTGEKPFECGVCKMRFRRRSGVLSHNLIHTGEKPFECGECKKRFATKSGVVKHIRFHTGDRPYECGECKKRFTTKSDIVTHRRIHTGEKPYECEVCSKRFTTKSQVHLHCRIHTGEKPHECGQCQKRFRTKSLLNQHSRIHRCETLTAEKKIRTKSEVV